MSSIATLKKKAKAGDADALKALVELVASKDQSIVIQATSAIGTLGTKEGLDALRTIILESPNSGARFVAMRKLDRAIKKNKAAALLLIDICTDPRVDKLDYPITCLSGLVSDARVNDDPRIIASLRRAIDAEHIYAQEGAIAGLIEARDAESLDRIVALAKGSKKRGPDLGMWIAEAIVKLGGTQAHLDRVRGGLEDHWVLDIEKRLSKRDKAKKKGK